jgi:hypothetical protein
VKHGKNCDFYQRSNNQPLCEDCKGEIERKMKGNKLMEDTSTPPQPLGKKGQNNQSISGNMP